jgi:phosphoglycerate kinase
MKKKIDDYDLYNKTVIVRCDFNVPIKEGIIQDDTRIRASLKTLNYCIDKGAKVVILSHLGKIKSIDDLKKNSLYPVSIRLGELLGKRVLFSYDTRSSKLTDMVSSLKIGDVLLVENTRYEDLEGKKESSCDLELAKYWASLGDIFINDAYGTCHREHASNVGICKYLPSGLGFLVSDEIEKLEGILNEGTHPFIVIMGGAKVSDKIKVISNLVLNCDKLLIGGGMAYTFLAAMGYKVGNSLVDEDSLNFCKMMLEKYGEKIVLPVDSIVSESIDSDKVRTCDIDSFKYEDMGLDIGPKTIELFREILEHASRVVMNGPMGVFENPLYQEGTLALLRVLKDNNVKTLIGGGDSVAAVNKLGFGDAFYHVSTGGGATLEYLEGKVLPGIGAINDEEEGN